MADQNGFNERQDARIGMFMLLRTDAPGDPGRPNRQSRSVGVPAR